MSYHEDQDDDPLVLDPADQPIVADAIPPEPCS